MNLFPEKYVQVLYAAPDAALCGDIISPSLKTGLLSAAAVLFLLALFWLYRSALAGTRRELSKARQRLEELSAKMALMESRSLNITESLVYAHQIQKALLPGASLLTGNFAEHFIHHLPKDIVSGDFYRYFMKDNTVFIITADCTGHGVPGAMMSMIGQNLINNLIRDNTFETTGSILNSLDNMVRRIFPDDRSGTTGIRQGMDIAVCSVNLDLMKLEFSGAFSSLYYVSGDKLHDLKGDRIVLGMKPEGSSFSTRSVTVEKGDPLYLFTDGYADQFGGREGKKFMYRRLRYLLTTINRLPMNDQKIILEDTFVNWKGDNEQVDDVLVLGIRL